MDKCLILDYYDYCSNMAPLSIIIISTSGVYSVSFYGYFWF